MASDLTHFGVKGMHWGQHKYQSLVPSGAQVRTATKNTGKAAVVTGKVVGKGALVTAKVAGKSISYVAHHKRMIAGGIAAALVLHDVGKLTLRIGSVSIITKAAKNREAGKVALKALSATAAKINYAKMVRGAYKITTL